MAYSRVVGENIDLIMHQKGIQATMIAEKLGYTLTDVARIVEGVLLIDGTEMCEIADVLGVELEELSTIRDESEYKPLLHCMGTYEHAENKHKILDFMDLYIGLEEAIEI